MTKLFLIIAINSVYVNNSRSVKVEKQESFVMIKVLNKRFNFKIMYC